MKHLYTLLIAMCCGTMGMAQMHNMTFQVDMNNYTGTFTEAHVNGTFNGWCGTCNPMTDANMDGIWDVTLPLAAGTHEFKFTVDGWTDQENFVGGESCTVTAGGFTNRSLVLSADSTMPVNCFNSCDSCMPPPPTYNVTFQVDMSEYSGTFNEAHVNGTFNGWCGTCNPMTDANMDGVWEVTLPLPAGAHEFKYTVDGWTDQENFVGGETCTMTTSGFTNRVFTLSGDTTLNVNCFNSCASCVTNPYYDLTFQVDMAGNPATFTEGHLNGTFNGWCGTCNPMTDGDMDGVWDVTLNLPAGIHEFKYTTDGWTDQENFAGGETCTMTTGGFTNRVIDLQADSTLPELCWNTCDPCGPALDPVNVTFQVDMTNEFVCNQGDSVDIAGSFTNWGTNPVTMTNTSGNIYEVTVEVFTNTTYMYKFRNRIGASEKWESSSDRTLLLTADNDTTLALVCFEETGACGPTPPAAANVTFQVDMTNEVPGDSIWLIGSFTTPQWQDGKIELTAGSVPGLFTTTVNICPETFSYKFVNGDVSVTANEEFDGETVVPCGVANGLGGFNREVTRANANDTTLRTVFFSSCDFSSLNTGEAPLTIDFDVFPNPLSGSTTIRFENQSEQYNIQITDLTGKSVYSSQHVGAQMELDASALSSGVYILQVSQKTGARSYEKLIVE